MVASSSLLFCFVPALVKNNLAFHTTSNNVPRSSRSLTAAAASTISSTVDLLPIIREAVTEAGGDNSWRASTQILTELFEDVEAEMVLATAFRWKDWAKASEKLKKYQKPTLPDPTKIKEGLTWLQEGPLELTEDQVRRSIQEYPHLYLVDPQDWFRKVNGVAPRKYRNILPELIQNDPSVLQVTYNCDGEGCASECGSCWVAYANRLA